MQKIQVYEWYKRFREDYVSAHYGDRIGHRLPQQKTKSLRVFDILFEVT